jgi:hypothetical protein
MLSRISAYSVTRSARIRSVDFFAFQDEASYSLPTASRPVGPMLPRVSGLENFLSISPPLEGFGGWPRGRPLVRFERN